MTLYTFTVTLDRTPNDRDYDLLFESGLDDTTPGIENGVGTLAVSREAESLSAAVVSIVQHARQAGFVVTGMR